MKRIVFFAIILVSLFVIQSLVRSIHALWQKHDLLAKAELELKKEKKDNEKLKRELIVVESQSFIEAQARNKLFLQKPDESRVIIDERLLQAALGAKSEAKKETKPNWQQWLELFF